MNGPDPVSIQMLRLLARGAFSLPALRPVPGWHLGSWVPKTRHDKVRLRLWHELRRRGYDGPLITPWHAGLKLAQHLQNDMTYATFVEGRYDPNEMCALRDHAQSGMQVVDGGANEGLYSIFLARAVGAAGRVYAFEPSPRERSRLELNVHLNHLGNVEVLPLALGREAGRQMLKVADADHPGHNTLGEFSYPETKLANEVEVEITTLDQFAVDRGLARVDILKLDIEGAEVLALQGGRSLIARSRPLILVEAHDPALQRLGSSVVELVECLSSLGYTLHSLADGAPCQIATPGPSAQNLLCIPGVT